MAQTAKAAIRGHKHGVGFLPPGSQPMTTSARQLLRIAVALGCMYATAQVARDAVVNKAITANQVAGVYQHGDVLLGVAKSYRATFGDRSVTFQPALGASAR